jgi:hypothetical protein
MDAAEARLASALVAIVGGTKPVVSVAHVTEHLVRHFQVDEEVVFVHRY